MCWNSKTLLTRVFTCYLINIVATSTQDSEVMSGKLGGEINLTVANFLHSVIACGYCNTGMKLFICSTEIKWINSCASSLPAPVALFISFRVCSFGFICVVRLNLSVCFACSFSRCIHGPSQVTDPQSAHLLRVCPPSRLQTGSCAFCQNNRSEAKTLLPLLLMRLWPSSSVHSQYKALSDFKWLHMHDHHKNRNKGG